MWWYDCDGIVFSETAWSHPYFTLFLPLTTNWWCLPLQCLLALTTKRRSELALNAALAGLKVDPSNADILKLQTQVCVLSTAWWFCW